MANASGPLQDPPAPTQTPAAGADSFITRLKQGATASREKAAAATPSPPPDPITLQVQAQTHIIEEQMREMNEAQAASESVSDSFHRNAGNFIRHLREGNPTAPPKPRTIACMITHGMGEQVPFETAADTAAAFVRGRMPKTAQANRVALTPGGDLISRMELHYEALGSEPETIVHVYEGYWAPLTEGKITYKSILNFLLSTGSAAFRIKRDNLFNRWIFNALRALPIKARTRTYLLVTLAAVLLVAGFIALAFFELDHLWTMLKGFAALPFHTAVHDILTRIHAHPGKTVVAALVLPAAWLAYWIRWFLVEYVGDVVIYVSSYKVSEYEEIRDAIQKTVFDVGKQIVAAPAPPPPAGYDAAPGSSPFLYDGILFAGHSLGSVITFDLINALITWDTDGCAGGNDLVNRITRFLTFGSPLDKTAFLFRTQISKQVYHYRELMAGNMQALTLDYDLRPFPWINLYSHRDPVSGCLVYYDLPPGQPLPPGAARVVNILDPAARIPGLAHTQYWQGMLLSQHLLAGVGLTMSNSIFPTPVTCVPATTPDTAC